MKQPPPTLDRLRLAWELSLMGKVQIIELQSWGESTLGLVRKTVEDYAELEAAYVADMVDRRRRHAEPKKGGPLHRDRQ
jgi:hypothetical protein